VKASQVACSPKGMRRTLDGGLVEPAGGQTVPQKRIAATASA
jgi:hypothetical protein